MRIYNQAWDYTLTVNSLPYNVNGGGPAFVSGWYRAQASAFINRGGNGPSPYTFHADNYDGAYAFQFKLRVAAAGNNMMAMSLIYGTSDRVPLVQKLASGVRLGWGYFNTASVLSGSSLGLSDDQFNLATISELGEYTVTFLKRNQASLASEVSAHVVTPSGVHYRSGWNFVTDIYNRNQLGSNNQGSAGYFEFGTLLVADQLTPSEAETIRTTGVIPTTPIASISPAGGNKTTAPILVTVSPDPDPTGWTLRYTTNGSDPVAGGSGATSFLDPPTLNSAATKANGYRALVEHQGLAYSFAGNDILVYNPADGTSVAHDVGVAVTDICSNGTILYFVTNGSGVYSLNTTTFAKTLVAAGTGRSYSKCVFNGSNIYAGESSGYVWEIDPIGGIETQVSLDSGDYSGGLAWFESVLYAADRSDGYLYSIDIGDGFRNQVGSFPANFVALAVFNTKLYGFVYEGNVYEINVGTGDQTEVTSVAQKYYYGAGVVANKLYAPIQPAVGTDISLYEIANFASTPGSTVYTAPFNVGAPFTPGTSVTVKAVYTNDTTSELGSIASVTYSFVMDAPIPSFGFGSGANSSTNQALTWTNPPTDGITEIWYTYDGSDPKTSLTKFVWAPGSFVPFNASPEGVTPSTFQITRLKAVYRHVASGGFSTVLDYPIYFELAPIVTSLDSGFYEQSISVDVSCASPGSILYSMSQDGSTTLETYPTNPVTVNVPFSASPAFFHFAKESADGMLTSRGGFSGSSSKTYQFKVGAPQLDKFSVISGVPVNITATPTTPGSVVHYTLDGSVPTAASPTASGAVSVTPGQVFKAVAVYLGVSSSVAFAEVLEEYEVSLIATSYVGPTRYHYYQSTQRIELLEPFGIGDEAFDLAAVEVPTNNVLDTNLWIWETGGSVQLNMLPSKDYSGLQIVNSGELSHPCRLAFDVASNINFALDLQAEQIEWMTETATFPLRFKFSCREAIVFFDVRFTSGGDRIVRRTIDIRDGSAPTVATTTTPGSIVAGVHNASFVITPSSIVLTGFGATHAVTINGSKWRVSAITNPGGATSSMLTPPVLIDCPITISALAAKLLKSPASFLGNSTTTTTDTVVARTIAIDSKCDVIDSTKLFKHWSLRPYNSGMIVPANVGFDHKISKVVARDNNFCVAFNDMINTSLDFAVELDLNALIPVGTVLQSSNKPKLVLSIEPANSYNEHTNSGQVSLTYLIDDDNGGYYSTKLVAQAAGDVTSTTISSSDSRRLTLKIVKTGSSVKFDAIVDGAAIDLGSKDASAFTNGLFKVFIKRSGGYDAFVQPQVVINNVKISGTSSARLINTVLSGADFIARGVKTGFDATDLTLPLNTIGTIYFNTTTDSLQLDDLGFEPTDGRILIGVYETDNLGLKTWTNLIYANLIKFREETNAGLGNGFLIGVGTKLRLDNGKVHWIESGIDRSRGVGESTWQTPFNSFDVQKRIQYVRAIEHQRINVSLVKAPGTPGL